MYNLPTENADVPCANCRRIMIDLSDYITLGDDNASLDTGYIGRGRDAEDLLSRLVFEVGWNALAAATLRFRRRLRYRRDLAQYPNSLICPACLHVLRRS